MGCIAMIIRNTIDMNYIIRSQKIIDLGTLYFSDLISTAALSDHILLPNEYVLVVDEDNENLFSDIDQVIFVQDMPSLNNAADELSLSDNNGQLIDLVHYDQTWYRNENKKNGGWSLECIDPHSNCRGRDNWIASEDISGGTPARPNSVVNREEVAVLPGIAGLEILAVNKIQIEFEGEMDPASLQSAQPIELIPFVPIEELNLIHSGTRTSIDVEFAQPLNTRTLYSIAFSDSIRTCSGHTWQEDFTLKFGLPEQAQTGDLIISEILFDASTGVSEFVELYNASSRILDLGDLWLAFDSKDAELRLVRVEIDRQIFPGQWVVFCNDPVSVITHYTTPFPKRVFPLGIPSLPNDTDGQITLFAFDEFGDTTTIDKTAYSEDFHDPLLESSKGISLERIRYELSGMLSSNWYSAAITKGGGSPTGENTQRIQPREYSQQYFSLESPTFSPDNDGYEDMMILHYDLPQSGFVADVQVYSSSGYPVRRLVHNQSLGANGQILWSGDQSDGNKARIGIYFIVINAITSGGDKLHDKLKVILARDF